MDKSKDEISEWLYKIVCADYEQYAILSFKVVELQRNEMCLIFAMNSMHWKQKNLVHMGFLNWVNSQAVMNASRIVSITCDVKLHVLLKIRMIAKILDLVGDLTFSLSHQK
jgi:hypothetical protein